MATEPGKFERTFRGIHVSLEFFRDAGELCSECVLSIKLDDDEGRPTYAATLHMAESFGYLPLDEGGSDTSAEKFHITQRTLNDIRDWAEEHGY